MQPLVSLEMRWFLLRSLPAGVERWFREQLPATELSPEDSREDIYLCPPLHESYGIKLRSDRLEIKWRESAAPFHGAHNVEGQVERWLKWSWKDDLEVAAAGTLGFGFPSGPWCAIKKKRWQRKYAWNGRTFMAAPWRPMLTVGAAIEMTKLEVDGRKDGTVLVESFAPDRPQQEKLLAAAVEYLWRDWPEPRLEAIQSYGYSRWLATLAIAPLSEQ